MTGGASVSAEEVQAGPQGTPARTRELRTGDSVALGGGWAEVLGGSGPGRRRGL